MNISSILRRFKARWGNCAVMCIFTLCGLTPGFAQQAPSIPRQLPPGIRVVKTYSVNPDDNPVLAKENQLVSASFQSSREITECIEEYADGSRALRYYVPPYLVTEHRKGPVLVDLRGAQGGDGAGQVDFFEELRWTQNENVLWQRKEGGGWIGELGGLRVIIDGESGFPREFSAPRIKVSYSLGETPSGGIRVPEGLLSTLQAYEARRQRPAAYLLKQE